MTRSLVSRADLARVIGDAELEAHVAATTGYQKRPPKPVYPPQPIPHRAGEGSEETELPVPIIPDYEPTPAKFWCATSFEATDVVELVEHETTRSEEDAVWREPPETAPEEDIPLASSKHIATTLRRVTPAIMRTRELDVPRLVRELSRGGQLRRLPFRQRKTWNASIHLVKDRADRLIPYWRDQDEVEKLVKRLFPHYAVQVAQLTEGCVVPEFKKNPYQLPSPSSVVMVLGDLGTLDREGEASAIWESLGKRYRRNGNRRVALLPCRQDTVPGALRRLWRITSWEPGNRRLSNCPGPEFAQDLLRLLSPASAIEPALLRSVRRLLPEGRSDAGLESLVWQALSHRNIVAGSMNLEMAAKFRDEFNATVDSDLQMATVELIRSWQYKKHPLIWFDTLLNLDTELHERIAKKYPHDLDDAHSYLRKYANGLDEISDRRAEVTARAFCYRFTERSRPDLYRNPAFQAVRRFATSEGRLDTREPMHRIQAEVLQQSDEIVCRTAEAKASNSLHGSPLGRLNATVGLIEIAHVTDGRVQSQPPAWVSDQGTDEFGIWAEFQVEKSAPTGNADGVELQIGRQPLILREAKVVTQRMRWIQPGKFMMGSPEDEEERYDDEGPQREVTLTNGYWMFDTPVTQELWEAVMGDNPSEFEGAKRPVEQVSWEDAQQFIGKLNERVGLNLVLPTEAQWEYACRAGTETRYAFGDSITTDDARFDSEDGTVDVKSFNPNPWGLYDMHGNVYEWCADWWSDDYEGADEVDPVGLGEGQYRVIRGGSWDDTAQHARSAYRHYRSPDYRDFYVGFRCAQVQQQDAAEPAEGGWPSRGGAQAVPTTSGEAAAPKIDSSSPHQHSRDSKVFAGNASARRANEA